MRGCITVGSGASAALVKLRQFGELQAQQVAAYAGQFGSREENQA